MQVLFEALISSQQAKEVTITMQGAYSQCTVNRLLTFLKVSAFVTCSVLALCL